MLLNQDISELARIADDAAEALSRRQSVEHAQITAGLNSNTAEWNRLQQVLDSGML